MFRSDRVDDKPARPGWPSDVVGALEDTIRQDATARSRLAWSRAGPVDWETTAADRDGAELAFDDEVSSSYRLPNR
jgi:hypothetical protein